jgi:hypothetical protein
MHLKNLRPGIGPDELNPLVWQYTMELYARLDGLTTNGLIVRDGVIDWYYDRILPVFLGRGYKLFVIALDVSDEKAKELIVKRGDTSTLKVERAFELLEDHKIHQPIFRAKYPPDITLTDDTLYEHDRILKLLADRLASMA